VLRRGLRTNEAVDTLAALTDFEVVVVLHDRYRLPPERIERWQLSLLRDQLLA